MSALLVIQELWILYTELRKPQNACTAHESNWEREQAPV